MKKRLKYFKINSYALITLFICTFLISCVTDVPLSFDRSITVPGLIGIWTNETGGIYYISKQVGTNAVQISSYGFDEKLHKYKKIEDNVDLYFKRIQKNGLDYNFLSLKSDEEYWNFAFKVSNKRSLSFWEINCDLKGKVAAKTEKYTLKRFYSVSNFVQYIFDNLENDNLLKERHDFKYEGNADSNTLNQVIKRLEQEKRVNLATSRANTNASTFTERPKFSRDLNEILYYSYYDAVYIQKSVMNKLRVSFSKNCIKSFNETSTYSEPDKKTLVPVYEQYMDSDGNWRTRYSGPDEITTRGESYTYVNKGFKNTCSYDVGVKGLTKKVTNSGISFYQDNSYVFGANEALNFDLNIQKNINFENMINGKTSFYENDLPIDVNIYNKYLSIVSNRKSGTLYVDSDSRRTSIFLNAGDKIKLTASGTIRLGAFAGETGPSGINGFEDYSYYRNLKHGSLIYYITNGIDDISVNQVGTEKMIYANKSGYLYILINDYKTEDNEGYFLVDFEIIKAK